MLKRPTYHEMQTLLIATDVNLVSNIKTRTTNTATINIKVKTCDAVFGLKPFDRINTNKGKATVIGLEENNTPFLWGHLDQDAVNGKGVSYWSRLKKYKTNEIFLQACSIERDEEKDAGNQPINDFLFITFKDFISAAQFSIDYRLPYNECKVLLSANLRLFFLLSLLSPSLKKLPLNCSIEIAQYLTPDKINHNELLSVYNHYTSTEFGILIKLFKNDLRKKINFYGNCFIELNSNTKNTFRNNNFTVFCSDKRKKSNAENIASLTHKKNLESLCTLFNSINDKKQLMENLGKLKSTKDPIYDKDLQRHHLRLKRLGK